MKRLLRDLKNDGYPLDFLLARLRGRRPLWPKHLTNRQREQIDPWMSRQTELYWLYKTMNRTARYQFGLCFLHVELRRLLIALRRLSGRSREGLEQLSEQSLLNQKFLRRLQRAADVADAARLLDSELDHTTCTAPRLEKTLTEQGQRQMEEQLFDTFFRFVVSRACKPAVRCYFAHLIDLRNMLSILKSKRWQLAEWPPFLAGGSLTPEQWRLLQRPGQELRLRQAILRISGSDGFDAESVEHAFLGRVQRRLHRQARAEPEAFLLLDYLWARDLHTRNLGLQRWAGDQLAAWEKIG